MVSSLARRAALAILGLALMLGWWTLTGKSGGGKAEAGAKMPAVLWGGVEGPLVIETDLAKPGALHVFFEEHAAGEAARHLNVEEPLPAGPKRFEVRTPPGVGATIQVVMERAKDGDRMFYALSSGDAKVYQFDETFRASRPDAPETTWDEDIEIDDCATCDRERIEAIYRDHPELKKW